MNKLRAFLTVFVSLVLSLFLMSLKNENTSNATEEHFLIYVIVGACALLIFLFVIFVLKGMKGFPAPFSSPKKKSQHEKSLDKEFDNDMDSTSKKGTSSSQ